MTKITEANGVKFTTDEEEIRDAIEDEEFDGPMEMDRSRLPPFEDQEEEEDEGGGLGSALSR